MSVFKIEKTKDFTIMSNFHLRDRNLSFKAKGLLSFMLILPPDWDYSLKDLCVISKENRDAISSTLKEFQDNHYLEIENVRGNKGYLYEKPHILEQDNENNPDMENQLQINTNIQNINKQIDKDDKNKEIIDKIREIFINNK